jgi:hypothetical protein
LAEFLLLQERRYRLLADQKDAILHNPRQIPANTKSAALVMTQYGSSLKETDLENEPRLEF